MQTMNDMPNLSSLQSMDIKQYPTASPKKVINKNIIFLSLGVKQYQIYDNFTPYASFRQFLNGTKG